MKAVNEGERNRNGNVRLVELQLFHRRLNKSLRTSDRMVPVLLQPIKELKYQIIPPDLYRRLPINASTKCTGTCDGPEVKVFQDYFFSGSK